MNVIRNLDDLERVGTLEHGDIVEFAVDGVKVIYYVTSYYLETIPGGNDKIFNMLNISYGDKRRMASEAYGYSDSDGGWPQYEFEDFAGATKLVKALYEIIERDYPEIKRIVFPNFNQT